MNYAKISEFKPSELGFAETVAAASLRLSHADKEALVALTLKVHVPEVRAAIFVAAANLELDVPEQFEAEAAHALEEHDAADGHRASRGAKISAGHRRRREAEAELKSAAEAGNDADVAVLESPHRAMRGSVAHEPGVARPTSPASLGPRISVPSMTMPRAGGVAPSSAARPASTTPSAPTGQTFPPSTKRPEDENHD